jgi:CheY-like chemotaxis protein
MARIVLIDDHSELRELLVELLREVGHSVFAFDGGARALEFMETGCRPDVVLSDFMLPKGSDGLQVAESLRSLFRDDPVPFVLMSGRAQPVADEGRLGDTRWVTKPFDFDDLLSVLNECLHDSDPSRASA